MTPEPDYLVDAPTAAAYVAHLRGKPCAPGTIWSWATRGHIHRLARGRYDIREIDTHTRKVLMAELLEWYRAQLDEDEQDLVDSERGIRCEARGLHLSPDRARAEIDSKRRILDTLHHEGGVHLFADIFKLLALPYADRPGYLDAWRPDA